MLRGLRLLLLFILPALLTTGCEEITHRETRSFDFEYTPGMHVALENRAGDIFVDNWDENYVAIKVVLTGMAVEEATAREIVQKTEIDLTFDGDRLTIGSSEPEMGLGEGLRLEYMLRLPEEFHGEISSSTGNINIAAVRGDLVLSSNTGQITLDRICGDLLIEGGTGDVSVNHLEGSLGASTNTGNIFVRHLTGGVDIQSSTGNVRMARAHVVGGEHRVQTSTGNVYLYTTGGSSLVLSARSGTGVIMIEGWSYERVENNEVESTIGGGEGRMRVETSTGDIHLERINN